LERDRHKAFKIGELDLERNLLGELDLERNLLGELDLERNLPREDGLDGGEDDIVDVVPTKSYLLCMSGRDFIKARITLSFMLGR
jgi:hypothetical protein